ncbi:matrix remodeling-associated protein 8-like [Colossoma macropomum]|uniref:matrix remodeling-associated protein 8-like n=1 Tax=Colossoma macropomum TaxID=42526 RepID=UPI001863BF17|nr:matrix remodeling-associated protein 8-like [Colossoma macropomum]
MQLGHSATVSCHLNCSTVTWWSKGIEVFQIFKIFEFSEGKCTVAPEFKDRTECSEEKIRGGDVSLTITSVVYNDQGWYYCSCDGKDQCNRRIEVLVPTTLSISFGGKATLPCYAETDKRTVDYSAYVLWEKDEQQVLKLENGNMSYGSGFEQRATVSTESYRKGDLSLTIDCVTFSDSGLYRCSLKDGGHGYPGAIILVVEGYYISIVFDSSSSGSRVTPCHTNIIIASALSCGLLLMVVTIIVVHVMTNIKRLQL